MLALCVLMLVRTAHSQSRETIWYYALDAEEADWSGSYTVIRSGDCPYSVPSICWDVGGDTAQWTKSTGSLLDDYYSIQLRFKLSARGTTTSKGCVVDYSTDNGGTFNDILRTTNYNNGFYYNTAGEAFSFGNPSSLTYLSIRLAGAKGNLNCYFREFRITGIPITSNPTGSPSRNPSASPTDQPSVPSTPPTLSPSAVPSIPPTAAPTVPTLSPSVPTMPPSQSPTATTYWSAWINSRSYVGGAGYSGTKTRSYGPHSGVYIRGFGVSTFSCTYYNQYSGPDGGDGSGDPISWCDMRGQNYAASSGQCFKGIEFRFSKKFDYPIIQYIRFQQTDGTMKGYSSYSWSYHKGVYANGPNDCITAVQAIGGRSSSNGAYYPEQMRVLFHRSWLTPAPSPAPTVPTTLPSPFPTHPPTARTAIPTQYPTQQTTNPTTSPSSKNPTRNPTVSPVVATTNPTDNPTNIPSDAPTTKQTSDPTFNPTNNPSVTPTALPTSAPTLSPTPKPTSAPLTPGAPTRQPTVQTSDPSANPTLNPTKQPTENPTLKPTLNPTLDPSVTPTTLPTSTPTLIPTLKPTAAPLTPGAPTRQPTVPTSNPSTNPTDNPTVKPTLNPTKQPTDAPYAQGTPTNAPQTSLPTDSTTIGPTASTTRTTAVPSRSTTIKPSSSSTSTSSIVESTISTHDKDKKDVSNVDTMEFIPTIIPGVSNVIGGLIVLIVGLIVMVCLCVCLCKCKSRNKGKGQIINESDCLSETELADARNKLKSVVGKGEDTFLTKGKQETMESVVVADDSDDSALLAGDKRETETRIVAEDSDAEMDTPIAREDTESHVPPPPEPRAKCIECGKYSTGNISDVDNSFYCKTCYQNI
eukprot:347375_1